MRKSLLLICLFMSAALCSRSQNISIKGSVFGIPLGDVGTYLGNLGFDFRFPKTRNSLELNYCLSGLSIVADAPVTSRRWGTIAFQHFWGSKEIRKSPFFSVFTEFGQRKIEPGKIDYQGDSILHNNKANEISPGISIGQNFRLGKRWVIQSQIGPKIIFARYTTTYYHSISSTFTEQKHNEIKAGMRFQFSFCYQL